MTRHVVFALIIALLPSLAHAQSFGLDDTWSRYPQTPALQEVRQEIEAGKCGADAVKDINERGHFAAVFVAAGSNGPYGVIQWYDKPLPAPYEKCGSSKFQWFGAETIYPQGWEVGLWSPDWTTQAPRWRLNPYAPPNTTAPAPVPPPVVVTPPPAPTVDVEGIVTRAKVEIIAAVQADGDKTRAEAKSNWDAAKTAFYAIAKYVGPAVAAWIAAKKVS